MQGHLQWYEINACNLNSNKIYSYIANLFAHILSSLNLLKFNFHFSIILRNFPFILVAWTKLHYSREIANIFIENKYSFRASLQFNWFWFSLFFGFHFRQKSLGWNLIILLAELRRKHMTFSFWEICTKSRTERVFCLSIKANIDSDMSLITFN